MFDTLLRQIKDRLFASVAKMLNIPPNLVTAFSLILGGLTISFILKKLYLVSLIFWILNRFFDGLDGAIARAHQRQTDLGGYLDILSDFMIYAAIPISLVVNSPTMERYFYLTLMISTFYVNAALMDVPISNFREAGTRIKNEQRGHNGNYAQRIDRWYGNDPDVFIIFCDS